MTFQNSGKLSPMYVIMACFFVASLMISNIIAGKIIRISGIILPSAVIIFPVSYILGDVLTEVYGYKRSRLVIWTGFVLNAFMVLIFLISIQLPYPEFWKGQEAYAAVLGYTPRLLAASFIAYLIGEFSNSIIMSRMKLVTKGRWLWARIIGSTIVGEGLDTVLFISIAFYGTIPIEALISMVLAQYLWKVGYETIVTPITIKLINWLKQKEGIDTFDDGVIYNPFSLEV